MSHSGNQAEAQNGGAHGNITEPQITRPDVGNKVAVVLGAQWGDEGKGKVVDLLAQDADIVCRCQVCHTSNQDQRLSFYLTWSLPA